LLLLNWIIIDGILLYFYYIFLIFVSIFILLFLFTLVKDFCVNTLPMRRR